MAHSKVVVVTGSNQGIGSAIVKRFLKESADWIVYLTARSEDKGKEAIAALEKEGGIKGQLRFHQLDITDKQSVLKLKDDLKAAHGGIDVLINNAAIAFKTADTSPYIHKAEVTLKTNFFATRYVFDELLPLLKNGARVVNMASYGGENALNKLSPTLRAAFTRQPPLSCDEVTKYMEKFIQDVKSGKFAQEGWPDDSAYGISKLGVIALTFGQQAILDKDARKDLVVNACCPGYASTNMTSYKGHKTIDEGADTPFYLATLPPNTTVKGKFVSERSVRPWQ